jgi:hypothetical protein
MPHVTISALCAQVAPEERAAREHIFVSRFAGRIPPENRAEICSGSTYVFPAEASRSHTQIQASHHRAFHADAGLGVVNALRCASVRWDKSMRCCE